MTDYEQDKERDEFRAYLAQREYDRGFWSGIGMGVVVGTVLMVLLVKFGPEVIR